jgi:outer membrane protein
MANEASGNGGSSDSPLAALSNIHDVALLQVSASWPVFNGFKTKNTKIMNEYLEQAAQYDAQTTRSNVALTTAKAIYQYYELLETRKTIEENLKQEQQRVTEFKNQEEQNLLARNDRLKAELQANNVELALTDVNNSVKLAEYNLTILLGLPEETTLELDTVGMFELAALTTWDQYLQTGLENRTELKSAAVQLKAGESGYKIAKANRLPTVALTAGYVNAFIPNVVNVTNALNGGVSLKYSITGALHASHGMQEARSRVEQAEASRQLATDQVKVDIRGKYLNCQKSLEKLAITKKAIDQAEENYQISQNKYKNGLLILSDYLEADVALLQARINYATARAESMIAYYELQNSVGTL